MADSAFTPRANCSRVPTGVEAIPATPMFGGFPQYGGGVTPPSAPDPIREAKPGDQSPPMQVGGGGGSALIAVMDSGGGPGPGTFRVIQVFNNGEFSPVGDPIAGMILGRY